MAIIKEVHYYGGRTFATANYESARYDYGMKATLEEGDDEDEVLEDLRSA